MSRSQWIVLVATATLALACFMPWVHIQNPLLDISGMDTAGTRFGKPAYNHFILSGLVLIFSFIPRLWAKRFNLLFAALNLAWAIRNFIVISRCEAGECPQKQWGLYLLLIAAIVLMLNTLFPDMTLPADDKETE